MKASIFAGLWILIASFVCSVGLAYAHGDDKGDSPPKTSEKSRDSSAKGDSPKATPKPLSAVESGVLNDLHAANLTEVAAGKMGEKRAVASGVAVYARMLVKDHTAADAKLSALAKRRNVTLISQAGDVSSLENQSGAAFDRAFLAMMVKNHADAIDKVKLAQKTCEDAEVKKMLDETLPRLEKHRAQALELQQDSEQHARAH